MEKAIRDFRDLVVWQRAMSFAEHVYAALSGFPVEERFGLSDQLRRAAVSIPSNIAEGRGRDSAKDFAHFLHLARGSLNEVMTQLELARRFGYLPECGELNAEAEEIGKMLSVLIRRLRPSECGQVCRPINNLKPET